MSKSRKVDRPRRLDDLCDRFQAILPAEHAKVFAELRAAQILRAESVWVGMTEAGADLYERSVRHAEIHLPRLEKAGQLVTRGRIGARINPEVKCQKTPSESSRRSRASSGQR